jgi:hypothetical protein
MTAPGVSRLSSASRPAGTVPSLAMMSRQITSSRRRKDQSSTRAATWWRRLRDTCGTRDVRPSLLSVLDLGFGVV